MDGDPLVLLELGRRVEVAARERRLRRDEGKRREDEQDPEPGHLGAVPKYVTRESPSSNV